jgi:hypothetical protein
VRTGRVVEEAATGAKHEAATYLKAASARSKSIQAYPLLIVMDLSFRSFLRQRSTATYNILSGEVARRLCRSVPVCRRSSTRSVTSASRRGSAQRTIDT